jgi:hypothetical protein
MSKISDIIPDDDSLERESPLLHSISKENPFSVPGSYFDSLPSQIMEKCRRENHNDQSSVANNFLYFILGYKWRLLALTGCLTLFCFFAVWTNNLPVSYETIAQTIPDSLIVQNLDKNIAYISESTLEDLSEDSPNTSSSVKSLSDSTNTDQNIIAYLIDNNVSVSDIENEPNSPL